MTPEAATPRPLPFDVKQLAQLERLNPGTTNEMVNLIRDDMLWQMKRADALDKATHRSRLLSIWLTFAVVVSIATLSTIVIVSGYEVAGSILASVDLVALANVFANSWRQR